MLILNTCSCICTHECIYVRMNINTNIGLAPWMMNFFWYYENTCLLMLCNIWCIGWIEMRATELHYCIGFNLGNWPWLKRFHCINDHKKQATNVILFLFESQQMCKIAGYCGSHQTLSKEELLVFWGRLFSADEYMPFTAAGRDIWKQLILNYSAHVMSHSATVWPIHALLIILKQKSQFTAHKIRDIKVWKHS